MLYLSPYLNLLMHILAMAIRWLIVCVSDVLVCLSVCPISTVLSVIFMFFPLLYQISASVFTHSSVTLEQ